MQRSPLAHLADIVEACDLTGLALRDLDLEDDRRDPIVRAAVERRFVTIGEAVDTPSRLDPVLADGIPRASMIVRHPLGVRAAVIPHATHGDGSGTHPCCPRGCRRIAVVTVSPTFRVVISKDVREKLGIRPGQKVKAFAVGNRVELLPAHPMRTFRGRFPGLPPLERERDRL